MTESRQKELLLLAYKNWMGVENPDSALLGIASKYAGTLEVQELREKFPRLEEDFLDMSPAMDQEIEKVLDAWFGDEDFQKQRQEEREQEEER